MTSSKNIILGALIAHLSACAENGKSHSRAQTPEPATDEHVEGSFNPDLRNKQPSTLDGGLDDITGPDEAEEGGEPSWRQYRWPIAAEKIASAETYAKIDDDRLRTGIILYAPQGTYVLHRNDMFLFGDEVKDTRLLESGEGGYEGDKGCGTFVHIRAELSKKIDGLGDSVDIVYCNLDFVADLSKQDLDSPKGVRIGPVGKSGGVDEAQLRMMLFSDGVVLHPYSVLKRE